jgi:hypothetical protein
MHKILHEMDLTMVTLSSGSLLNATIIWRTTPYSDYGLESVQNMRIKQINQHVMHNHPKHIHISNAAKHLNPKSHGAERESGDSKDHFNNIGRMVQIQCITHTINKTLMQTNAADVQM